MNLLLKLSFPVLSEAVRTNMKTERQPAGANESMSTCELSRSQAQAPFVIGIVCKQGNFGFAFPKSSFSD